MRRGREGRGERGRVGVMKNVGERGEKEKQPGRGGVFFYLRSAKGEGRKGHGDDVRSEEDVKARSTDHNRAAVSKSGQHFSRCASQAFLLHTS